MKKQIAVIGLGKMGSNLARQLVEKEWGVYGYNRTESVTRSLEKEGIRGVYSYDELLQIDTPRLVWIMVSAGEPVESVIGELLKILEKGDVMVDGGNGFYKEAKEHAARAAEAGIHFLDVGVSGGPNGARNGACMMVGGEKEIFVAIEDVFRDTCVDDGYRYLGKAGAGQFVKMVHNAIEYGMMQSIAEGFDILNNSEYNLNISEIASLYNHGSVVESKLMGWMKSGFDKFGPALQGVSGSAGSGGSGPGGLDSKSEGAWAVDVARELGISIGTIQESLEVRKKSRSSPNFQGKIINMLRNQFGGHRVESDDKS